MLHPAKQHSSDHIQTPNPLGLWVVCACGETPKILLGLFPDRNQAKACCRLVQYIGPDEGDYNEAFDLLHRDQWPALHVHHPATVLVQSPDGWWYESASAMNGPCTKGPMLLPMGKKELVDDYPKSHPNYDPFGYLEFVESFWLTVQPELPRPPQKGKPVSSKDREARYQDIFEQLEPLCQAAAEDLCGAVDTSVNYMSQDLAFRTWLPLLAEDRGISESDLTMAYDIYRRTGLV